MFCLLVFETESHYYVAQTDLKPGKYWDDRQHHHAGFTVDLYLHCGGRYMNLYIIELHKTQQTIHVHISACKTHGICIQ